MSNDRSYPCKGCNGKVSVPKHKRIPLETIRQNHEPTCPSRRAKQ